MRYLFHCEGCLTTKEIDLSLEEFEKYQKDKYDITCLECGWKNMNHVICAPTLSSKRVTNGY